MAVGEHSVVGSKTGKCAWHLSQIAVASGLDAAADTLQGHPAQRDWAQHIGGPVVCLRQGTTFRKLKLITEGRLTKREWAQLSGGPVLCLRQVTTFRKLKPSS